MIQISKNKTTQQNHLQGAPGETNGQKETIEDVAIKASAGISARDLSKIQFQQTQECFQLQQAQRQELLQLQQQQAQELKQLQQNQMQQVSQLTQKQQNEIVDYEHASLEAARVAKTSQV